MHSVLQHSRFGLLYKFLLLTCFSTSRTSAKETCGGAVMRKLDPNGKLSRSNLARRATNLSDTLGGWADTAVNTIHKSIWAVCMWRFWAFSSNVAALMWYNLHLHVVLWQYTFSAFSKHFMSVYIAQVSYLQTKYSLCSSQRDFCIDFISFVAATTKCYIFL